MKTYPKIHHYNNAPIDEKCIAFDKLDGSNLRFEWGHKRGWYKFGSRSVMIDRNTELLGDGIDIFLNKYGDELDKIFRTKYKKVQSFVVFGEFLGKNSFAGQHIDSDEKDVIMFDVNQYQKGFLDPFEFVENFGHLHIPNIIYEGYFNDDFIKSIQNNKDLLEGVVAKGIVKTKKSYDVWMTKVKTKEWLVKVKSKFGDKFLLEEFNNDITLYNSNI